MRDLPDWNVRVLIENIANVSNDIIRPHFSTFYVDFLKVKIQNLKSRQMIITKWKLASFCPVCDLTLIIVLCLSSENGGETSKA
jgi:hypothetical protein